MNPGTTTEESMADFVVGGLTASFAGNAESADQNVRDWRSTLHRYGGVDEDTAESIAMKLAENDFPMPMPELASVLTHDFLKEIGIANAGERVRVMLAVSLCPPMPKLVDEIDSREHVPADEVMLAVKPPGFKDDTDVVERFYVKPQNLAYQWFDLVGKNPDAAEYRIVVRDLLVRFQERQNSVTTVTSLEARRGGNDDTDESSDAAAAAGAEKEDPLAGSQGTRMDSARKKHYELVEPFDVFSAPRPLPVFLVSPNDDRFSSFVLRVPTPEVDFSEATIASLTNKWIVVVDMTVNMVATVHRVDSAALARLRHPRHRSMLDTITSRQLLITIFIAFIKDFNAVIDEAMEILDECEVKLLDKTAARWLIEHLVQLQRRASVYDRLIGLNQNLIRRVAQHYQLRDASDLDQRWISLRERTSSMETRSSTLLGLVLSLSGQRTADIMTVLTKFSMCISPLTVITGIYGMNFDNMPELRYENSYYIVLAGFVAITVGMLMWMKFIGL